MSLEPGNIPGCWKRANMMPALKKRKDTNNFQVKTRFNDLQSLKSNINTTDKTQVCSFGVSEQLVSESTWLQRRYAHQPDKKEYEFGFKRGNGYHTIERYEKGGPHHNFKTKVRWHDSKGGHGEHYWDYNHAPKYHDDHHDDDHHDDHGGDGHGYSDDHHGDDHGYGHDHHDGYGHHDDHGGYHSQPVPEFLPAASQNSAEISAASVLSPAPTLPFPQQIEKREGLARSSKVYESSDAYRPKNKTINKLKNKVGVDKDSGLDNKKKKDNNKQFHSYSEKQTFEYKSSSIPDDRVMERVESPSAFPAILGFDPYLPPKMASERYYPGTFLPEQKGSASHQLTDSMFPAGFGDGQLTRGSSAKDNEAAESNVDARVSTLPALTTLSFDLDTGRIYDEATEMWYTLVPFIKEEEEEEQGE
ncbi:hypothetical protein SK128_016562 [Halocaridina rubra]|uniref:Uncharacterized protein n=1 Tax=Halocaridina rubra TaxID=373956 RepID=A0AAN8XLR1_HALRR